ncbi:hypothetical protein ANCCEY_10262 [Ancylostoma ceylanicum]|uniref:Uncharacterized protein n=1 Tax=Ancylostoma ceylanicum TaxID=53326 RepID=A0A0D6LHH9_9BILA|nr:hypothetical protein ANCCEY_10262 [Ancylostoma ceylanicum]
MADCRLARGHECSQCGKRFKVLSSDDGIPGFPRVEAIFLPVLWPSVPTAIPTARTRSHTFESAEYNRSSSTAKSTSASSGHRLSTTTTA